MKYQGTVSAWSGHTSTGPAADDLLPAIVPEPVTTTPKTTLGSLGVAMLRKIAAAATCIIYANPGHGSKVLCGTSADLTLTAFDAAVSSANSDTDSGFSLELVAGAETGASRTWNLAADGWVITEGSGWSGSGISDDGKAAIGIFPAAPTKSVQQMIDAALASVPDTDAAVVKFVQDGTGGTLHVYAIPGDDTDVSAALAAITVGANKEILGVEFTESLPASETPSLLE